MTIKEVSEKYDITADTLRYYERVGAIPLVTRTQSGIRDYKEEDLYWVELAKCMRSAGLPIEAVAEYRTLFAQGNSTIKQRLDLLGEQREVLLAQQQKINETLELLNNKIYYYEEVIKTGNFDLEYSQVIKNKTANIKLKEGEL